MRNSNYSHPQIDGKVNHNQIRRDLFTFPSFSIYLAMTYLSTLVYKLHINAKLSVETKPGRTEKPPQNSTKYLWGGSQPHPEKKI